MSYRRASSTATAEPAVSYKEIWRKNEDFFLCTVLVVFALVITAMLVIFLPEREVQERRFFSDERRFRDLDVNSDIRKHDLDGSDRRRSLQPRSDDTTTTTNRRSFVTFMPDGSITKTYITPRVHARGHDETIQHKNAREAIKNKYSTVHKRKEGEFTQEEREAMQERAVVESDASVLPTPSAKEINGYCYTIEPFPIAWTTVPVPYNVMVDFSGLDTADQGFTRDDFLTAVQGAFTMWNGDDPIYSTTVNVSTTALAPASEVMLIQFGTYPYDSLPDALAVTRVTYECLTDLSRKRVACPDNSFQVASWYMVIQTDYHVFGDPTSCTLGDLCADIYDLKSVVNHEFGHSIGTLGDDYDYECQNDVMASILLANHTEKREVTPSVINGKKALGYVDARSLSSTAFGALASAGTKNGDKNDSLVSIICSGLIILYFAAFYD